jgi:hypothetical protein
MVRPAWVLVVLAGCGVTQGPLLTTRAPPARRPALLAWGGLAPRTVGDLDAVAAVWAGGPAFDGLVLSPGVDSPWQATRLDVTPALALEARLRQPPFDTLTGNLLSTRLAPGDVDDDDDAGFAQVVANFAALADAARRVGARGVMLDTQTYERQRFSFPAVAKGRPFERVQSSMRRRGAEVMSAMLAAHPQGVVVVTLGYAEVFRAVCLEGVTLAAERYGLLPAFLDGMRDALGPERHRQLIDGFLPAYATRDAEGFATLRAAIAFDEAALGSGPDSAVSYRYPLQAGSPEAFPWLVRQPLRCDDAVKAQVARTMPVGFGVMIDFKSEPFVGPPFAQNFHSPAGFAAVVKAALSQADDVVWLFSAQVDWWSRPGATALPAEYREALAQP